MPSCCCPIVMPLVALVSIVLLYSWRTGNTLRIETENYSLGFQYSDGK